jgi:hypothetical protein
MASVVDTTEPRTSPERQSNPGMTRGAPKATPNTVNTTRPTASETMLTRWCENAVQDVSHAAE